MLISFLVTIRIVIHNDARPLLRIVVFLIISMADSFLPHEIKTSFSILANVFQRSLCQIYDLRLLSSVDIDLASLLWMMNGFSLTLLHL
jgi:hypothetical protein